MNEPLEPDEPLPAGGLLALRRALAVRRADHALRAAERSGPPATTESGAPELPAAPAGLGDRLLGRALAARPAGRPTGPWAAEPIEPIEALALSQADLACLLDELEPSDWDRPVAMDGPADWNVRDVIAHLIAVEAYQNATLGHGRWDPPEGTEAHHTAMTQPTLEAMRGLGLEQLRSRWDDAVAAALAVCRDEAAKPGRLRERVTFTAIPFRVGTLMVLRAFEVWTHTDDIRRALGRPLVAPDGARLALMSDLAVNALPLGLALSGRPGSNRTARIVLTGPGGGTWSQPLGIGETAGEPQVVVVADVVDFCRLAARRIPADELVCHVEGDEALAADVLAGVAVFAA